MKKLFKLLAFLFVLAGGSVAHAQGFRYDNIALNQNGQPIVNVQIKVCAGDVTSGPVPCAASTPVYSNITLSTVIPQPFSTGPIGNYGFFIAPGTYTISFYGNNVTGGNSILTIPCTPSSSCGASSPNVSSLNSLTGAIVLVAGANTTITPSGQNLIISSSGGGGGGTGNVNTTGSPVSGNLTCFTGTTTISNCNLTGDVLTSGTSATTIQSGAVTTAKIAALAVTNALIAANAVTEGKIGLSDVTTDNCTIAAHGFAPKAPNDATKFLDGTCNYSTPMGGATPAGINGDLQEKNGTTLAAAPVHDTGTQLNQNENTLFSGPNPYIDITYYGARAVATVPSTTANITASTLTATLASASTFQTGDGVVIYGAGATNTLSTPSAPTVTFSESKGGMGTGEVVNAPAGSSTCNYEIRAIDKFGGVTAASSVGTTATCSTLGGISVNISTLTRANNTVSVVTSAPHKIAVGSLVYIANVSDATFAGFFIVSTAADSTHFTYTQGMDTRAGASTSATGGTAQSYVANHLTWTGVANAWEYAIYGRSGSAPYSLIGVSRPGELVFDDYGSPMMDNITLPATIPSTTSGGATNDYLVTTICAGGGTTTLTLCNAATNSVGGATIKFDDAPTILAAATAAMAAGTSGTLNIPSAPTNAFFVINSHLVLPNSINIKQSGQLTLNETVETGSQTTWEGDLGGSSNAAVQFAWNTGRWIQVNTAYPGLAMINGSTSYRYLGFSSNSQGLIATISIGGQFNDDFSYDNFSVGTGGTDYLGMALVAYGISNTTLDHDTFSVSDNGSFGASTAPLIFYRNDLVEVNTSGNVFCKFCFFKGRGFLIDSNPAIGTNIRIDFENNYAQALHSPLLAFTTGNEGMLVRLTGSTNDTSTTAAVANWSNGVNWVELSNIGDNSNQTGGMPGLVTGNIIYGLKLYNTSASMIGQNREGYTDISGQIMSVPVYGVSGGLNVATTTADFRQEGPFHFPSQNTLYFDLPVPTSPTATVAAGGSIPNGAWVYRVTAIGFDGGETTYGLTSSACTTTTGNNTCNIGWTAVTGAVGYNVYRSNGGGYDRVHSASNLTTNTYSDTFGFSDGITLPSDTGTGLTSITRGQIYTPLLTLSGPLSGQISFGLTLTPGTFTAARTWSLADVSGTPAIFTGALVNNDCPKISVTAGVPSLVDSGGTCGGGGSSPGGSNTQLQYNNSGTLGGIADLTFNGTHTITLGAAGFFVLTEGSTVTGITGAMLPNPSSSTLGGVESFAAVSSQWIRQISTSGVVTASQPAFTDISGTATTGQLPGSGATTVNSQTCTLGSTCTIPFQTGSVSNTSQAGLNFLPSTVNAVGLVATPVNAASNQVKWEISGANYSGTSALATALAANPIDCSSNQYANAIDAGANLTCTAVTDAQLSLSNITTNNVSTTKHGFAPILPNDATKFLDGTGNYSVPPIGSGCSVAGSNGDLQMKSAAACAASHFNDNATTITASETVTPSTAGGINLGSTTLMFGDLYLGPSTTDYFHFTTSSLTAARALTVPDASGTIGVSGTSPITLNATSGAIGCTTCGVTGSPLSQFASTTSAQLAGVLSDESGTGVVVFSTSPTLVTPTLGAALATSINGLTITSSTGTFTLTSGKTLSVSNTLTFTGTDGSSVAFGTGGTATYTSNNLSVFASTTSAQLAGVLSDETGTGVAVFGTSPTISTPTLTGTPDASGASQFKLPVAASGASAANGEIKYDTSNNNWHGYNNGSDLLFPEVPIGTPVNGDCVNWVVAASNVRFGDAGAACGSGSGGGAGGVDSQTTGYTAGSGDAGKIVAMNGSSITLTLPAAPPSNTWAIFAENLNATELTISRNGLNIDGAASNITLLQNQGIWISTDGTNYFTSRGISGQGIQTDVQTGTTYTIAASDRLKRVTFNNASAVAVTLPQAGGTGFDLNFPFSTTNLGAGDVTITPGTSTINGSSTLVVHQGQWCFIYSDNTNYFGNCTDPQIAVTANLSLARGATSYTLDLPNSGATATSCGDATHSCSLTINVKGIITANSNNSITGSGGGALSGLTAATGTNTIASGNNYDQIWNWALTTNNHSAFTFGETTAATSGTLGNQYIVKAITLAGSTAVPMNITSSLTGTQVLPTLYITPTWNVGTSVVDAALLINVTNTASGATSKLIDAQVGGTSEFNVDRTGAGAFLTSVATGTSPPACTVGTAGFWCGTEGTAFTNVSGTGGYYFDSTTHELMAKTNGASSAGMLVRAQPGSIHSTGNTALISTATLCASSAGACNTAGQYHVQWTFIETGTACAVPATGGVTFLLTWTDSNATAHSAVSLGMDDASAINAVSQTFHFQTSLGAAWASGDFNISTNGSIIQYATGYTACGTGTGTYQLDIVTTRVQ